MADSKVSGLAQQSVPLLTDTVNVVDAGTSLRQTLDRVFGLVGVHPGGRLTLTTAVPVTTADVAAAGTLYYTPYLHDRVRLYDGTRWRYYVFTERSLALTLTSGKNYDVFLYDNAGTLTLELSAAWTNDTTRADALARQDGVLVKSGAATRLWLGTIRASAANVVDDTLTARFVWNAYHRLHRKLRKAASSPDHAYAGGIRSWNNSTANRVEFVIGASEEPIFHTIAGDMYTTATTDFPVLGAGVDSTTAFGDSVTYLVVAAIEEFYTPGLELFIPSIGYHFIQALQQAPATGGHFTSYTLQGWVMG